MADRQTTSPASSEPIIIDMDPKSSICELFVLLVSSSIAKLYSSGCKRWILGI